MKDVLISILLIFSLVTSCSTKDNNSNSQMEHKYNITFPVNWEIKRDFMDRKKLKLIN